MYDHGAVFAPAVIENGEYYRLFTSMFLHFDFSHLMNNMIMLGALGTTVEPELGSIKTLMPLFAQRSGRQSVVSGSGLDKWGSGGVSRCVRSNLRSDGSPGVAGDKKSRRIRADLRQESLSDVGLSLYYGFTSTAVDNYAHVGGLSADSCLQSVSIAKEEKKKL